MAQKITKLIIELINDKISTVQNACPGCDGFFHN